jgi:Transcription factor zinc-finger
MDEKDRYGDKLHDVERAREEQWAHQRDEELLEKLRKKGEAALCPQCRKPLVAETRAGVAMMACADKHGAWLRTEVLEALLKRLTNL